jgi:putative transposase
MWFETHRAAMNEVIAWLSFYNHSRLHSTLGYDSFMQFERQWRADQVPQTA